MKHFFVPTSAELLAFKNFVLDYHQRHGRHHLPWRHTTDPYAIWVSETMLQQTQVDRVIPKYLSFFSQFPTVATLAEATPATVITAWQGLGYNRRCLLLHRAAKVIVTDHQGLIPEKAELLQKLPGFGPYTTAAVQAFAFNLPSIVIDTNIRSILLYHFFPSQEQVADTELTPLLAELVTKVEPKTWYAALMDYGSMLKKLTGNHTRRSKSYAKQSPFQGSRRQVRGFILRYLSHSPATTKTIAYELGQAETIVIEVIEDLMKDGFITTQAGVYYLQGNAYG